VELGTHTGNSYFAFCQAVSEGNLGTKCYAIDTWEGDEQAGHYGLEVFEQVQSHNRTHYQHFSRLLKMKFDEALSCFADQSIELLHIDGLHTYEAVRHDFETWLVKLAPGAVVLFHDTNVRQPGFGVWKLWEELENLYRNNLEFVHSHGLGVLQLDGAPDSKKLVWLDSNCVERQQLRRYFAALGARQLDRVALEHERIHVSGLKKAIAERDEQIAMRDKNIFIARETEARLESKIAGLESKIAGLMEEIHNRDMHLKRFMSSRSWRITAPVRYGKQLVSRVINCLR
jgi:hypothetical protein